MQISGNNTGMAAGLSVVVDKEARDHCVVVVKGTFWTDAEGHMQLDSEQRPPAYRDEHYGDPETTCVRHECDFVLEKPMTDVIVVGKAISPSGEPTTELRVRLEIQGRAKDVDVLGDRHWQRVLGRLTPSASAPFTEMPLTFERAFGGVDASGGPGKVAVEHRNLSGTGFHKYRSASEIAGTRLPNLEHPRARISSPYDRPEPIGFGCLGRTWRPRIEHAGTYDQRWLDEVCPFLPADFDYRYFQSAPVDQRFPRLAGGEEIRCYHMAADPVVRYKLPALRVPVAFRFVDRMVERSGVLDTVILEPHLGLAMLVWRASVSLGKKLNALREVLVGETPNGAEVEPVELRRGKPFVGGIDATIRWLRGSRRGGP